MLSAAAAILEIIRVYYLHIMKLLWWAHFYMLFTECSSSSTGFLERIGYFSAIRHAEAFHVLSVETFESLSSTDRSTDLFH